MAGQARASRQSAAGQSMSEKPSGSVVVNRALWEQVFSENMELRAYRDRLTAENKRLAEVAAAEMKLREGNFDTITRLEDERDRLAAALREAVEAMKAPLDGWKGDVERRALDIARAALAGTAEPREDLTDGFQLLKARRPVDVKSAVLCQHDLLASDPTVTVTIDRENKYMTGKCRECGHAWNVPWEFAAPGVGT